MITIKIFNGNADSVETDANEWLKENPGIVVMSASIHEMHDNYLFGDCGICNQWESLILVCKGEPNNDKN